MTNRILIVDDEPDIRELLEITLGRMSLTTSSAEDLASARHLLSTESFNLCLTDMRLPDGDGIELVEYIQKEYNQMPVAVITAHGTTEAAIKALKSGAFDFVSKPVDLQKLRDMVNSALRLSQEQLDDSSLKGKASSPNRALYNRPIGSRRRVKRTDRKIGSQPSPYLYQR